MAREHRTTPGGTGKEQEDRLEQMKLRLLDEAVAQADPELFSSMQAVREKLLAKQMDEPTAERIFQNAGKLMQLKREGRIPTDEDIDNRARSMLGLWKQ